MMMMCVSSIRIDTRLVSTLTGLLAGWPQNIISDMKRSFSLLHSNHSNSSPTHPRTYPVHIGCYSAGVSWPGHEADHPPPSSAQVKNWWSCNPTFHTSPYDMQLDAGNLPLEVYSIHKTMNTYAYNLIADWHGRVKKSMLSIYQCKSHRLSRSCQRGLLPLPHISVSWHTTTGGTAASCSGITVAQLIASPDQNLCPFKQTAIPGQAIRSHQNSCHGEVSTPDVLHMAKKPLQILSMRLPFQSMILYKGLFIMC